MHSELFNRIANFASSAVNAFARMFSPVASTGSSNSQPTTVVVCETNKKGECIHEAHLRHTLEKWREECSITHKWRNFALPILEHMGREARSDDAMVAAVSDLLTEVLNDSTRLREERDKAVADHENLSQQQAEALALLADPRYTGDRFAPPGIHMRVSRVLRKIDAARAHNSELEMKCEVLSTELQSLLAERASFLAGSAPQSSSSELGSDVASFRKEIATLKEENASLKRQAVLFIRKAKGIKREHGEILRWYERERKYITIEKAALARAKERGEY